MSNAIKKLVFAGRKIDWSRIEIGGASHFIANISDLMNETGLPATAIRDFNIDAEGNVSFETKIKIYKEGFLDNQNEDKLISFLHYDKDIITLRGDLLRNQNFEAIVLLTKKASSIIYYALRDLQAKYVVMPYYEGNENGSMRYFLSNNEKLKYVYAPKWLHTSSTNDTQRMFANIKRNTVFYLHKDFFTLAHPNFITDINHAINTRDAEVRLINNFDVPDSINDLSVIKKGVTYFKLNFTEPGSTNDIDFYEVWLQEVGNEKRIWEIMPFQEAFTDGDDYYVTGLKRDTEYKIKLSTVDEFYNGTGLHPESDRRAFSNEITVKTLDSADYVYDTALSKYTFTELSGDLIDQISSYNGTINGSIVRNGDSYTFNGSNTYIDLGNHLLNFKDAFSIVARVKISGSGRREVISRWPSTGQEFILRINDSNRVDFIRRTTANNNQQPTPNTMLNDGDFHTIIGTFSTTNGMRLYIDGNLDSSNANTTENSSGGLNQIAIGKRGGASGQYFNGEISDIILYEDYELSAQEVSDITDDLS